MFICLFLILVLAIIVEYLTTFTALKSNKAKEVNPIFRWILETLSLHLDYPLGFYVAMTLKFILTILILCAIWLSQSIVLVVIIELPLIYICYNNIKTLIKIWEKPS